MRCSVTLINNLIIFLILSIVFGCKLQNLEQFCKSVWLSACKHLAQMEAALGHCLFIYSHTHIIEYIYIFCSNTKSLLHIYYIFLMASKLTFLQHWRLLMWELHSSCRNIQNELLWSKIKSFIYMLNGLIFFGHAVWSYISVDPDLYYFYLNT